MAGPRKVTPPRRGEGYLLSFGPTLGGGVRKEGPTLVLQNDLHNRFSPITIVAAITSQVEPDLYPTEVLVKAPEGGLQVDSVVLLNQIRSIDRQRLIRRGGRLGRETMRSGDRALLLGLS